MLLIDRPKYSKPQKSTKLHHTTNSCETKQRKIASYVTLVVDNN